MPIEYEAKILNIDPDHIAKTIAQEGGSHLGNVLMRRFVYDITPGDQTQWIRLRDDGTTTTLAIKQIHHDGIDGTTETETTVGDFDTTNELLRLLGYTPKGYQETRRQSYILDGVQLEIDTWPRIPPYLEIEANNSAAVTATARRLGYNPDQLTSENTTKIYAHYGIDLASIPDLRLESTSQRAQALRDVIDCHQPLDSAIRALQRFGWDSDDELVTLSRGAIVHVLSSYCDGEMSASEVKNWAQALEGRDDVGREPGAEQLVNDALFALATPVAAGALNRESARSWITRLNT